MQVVIDDLMTQIHIHTPHTHTTHLSSLSDYDRLTHTLLQEM